MAEKSSIFDMIGPVLMGSSSSHTAGLKPALRKAQKNFYYSFARNYQDHGSDQALDVMRQSRGSGVIQTEEVNHFPAEYSAILPALIVEARDVKGSIAIIADKITHDYCDIDKNQVARQFLAIYYSLIYITLANIQQLSWKKHTNYYSYY